MKTANRLIDVNCNLAHFEAPAITSSSRRRSTLFAKASADSSRKLAECFLDAFGRKRMKAEGSEATARMAHFPNELFKVHKWIFIQRKGGKRNSIIHDLCFFTAVQAPRRKHEAQQKLSFSYSAIFLHVKSLSVLPEMETLLSLSAIRTLQPILRS